MEYHCFSARANEALLLDNKAPATRVGSWPKGDRRLGG